MNDQGFDVMVKTGSSVAAFAALALLSNVASASPDEGGRNRHDGRDADKTSIAAPEIDSAATLSGISLLLGGLFVLRGRKARA